MKTIETFGAIYRPGQLAYLDSFAGLIPCKVLSVPRGGPFPGWIVNQPQMTVKLTAARPGYKRGEVLRWGSDKVIPRDHVVTRGYNLRIRTDYSWSD